MEIILLLVIFIVAPALIIGINSKMHTTASKNLGKIELALQKKGFSTVFKNAESELQMQYKNQITIRVTEDSPENIGKDFFSLCRENGLTSADVSMIEMPNDIEGLKTPPQGLLQKYNEDGSSIFIGIVDAKIIFMNTPEKYEGFSRKCLTILGLQS